MFKNLLQSMTRPNPLETDVAQVTEARTDGTTQIVDVREPGEWAGGHIPGAIHIPLGQLSQATKKLDASRPVVTVCRSGNRSLTAVKVLKEVGFGDAKSMAGGMSAWVSAGNPVKR